MLSADSHSQDFAFIGGGSTGPMLLIYIAKKAQEDNISFSNVTFHLIDPKGFSNGGIAYGRSSEAHILNSVRTEMSPWDLEAFHTWCVANGYNENRFEFNRRADYGRFLDEQFKYAIDTLRKRGVNFEEHKKAAQLVKRDGNKFDIIDDNEGIIVSDIDGDRISLTVGYGPNVNFENLREYQGQGYIHSVYDLAAVHEIENLRNGNPRIAFVGAGPALYDFARDLNVQPEQLLVFSRENSLLKTRDTDKEVEEKTFDPGKELLSSFPENLAEFEETLQTIFDRARSKGYTERRAALDIMKNLGDFLSWVNVDVAQDFRQSSTLSKLKHAATPVPRESQEILERLNPQLVQAKLNGNIRRMPSGTFFIDLGNESYEVDVIVNGTGHQRYNHPVYQGLLDQGLAAVCPRLGVLETEELGGWRLQNIGVASIGPATHFGIDGMESFADKAEGLAQEVINSAQQKSHGNTMAPSVVASVAAAIH